MNISVSKQPKFIARHEFLVEAGDNIKGEKKYFAEFQWRKKRFFLLCTGVWKRKHFVRSGLVRVGSNGNIYRSLINIPEFLDTNGSRIEFCYPYQCSEQRSEDYEFIGFDTMDCFNLGFLRYEQKRLRKITYKIAEEVREGKLKITKPPTGLVV